MRRKIDSGSLETMGGSTKLHKLQRTNPSSVICKQTNADQQGNPQASDAGISDLNFEKWTAEGIEVKKSNADFEPESGIDSLRKYSKA